MHLVVWLQTPASVAGLQKWFRIPKENSRRGFGLGVHSRPNPQFKWLHYFNFMALIHYQSLMVDPNFASPVQVPSGLQTLTSQSLPGLQHLQPENLTCQPQLVPLGLPVFRNVNSILPSPPRPKPLESSLTPVLSPPSSLSTGLSAVLKKCIPGAQEV